MVSTTASRRTRTAKQLREIYGGNDDANSEICGPTFTLKDIGPPGRTIDHMLRTEPRPVTPSQQQTKTGLRVPGHSYSREVFSTLPCGLAKPCPCLACFSILTGPPRSAVCYVSTCLLSVPPSYQAIMWEQKKNRPPRIQETLVVSILVPLRARMHT